MNLENTGEKHIGQTAVRGAALEQQTSPNNSHSLPDDKSKLLGAENTVTILPEPQLSAMQDWTQRK